MLISLSATFRANGWLSSGHLATENVMKLLSNKGAGFVVLSHHILLMDYYSFNRPKRDGWLSWPCWLTGSGRFTHKVVTRPAVSQAQNR